MMFFTINIELLIMFFYEKKNKVRKYSQIISLITAAMVLRSIGPSICICRKM